MKKPDSEPNKNLPHPLSCKLSPPTNTIHGVVCTSMSSKAPKKRSSSRAKKTPQRFAEQSMSITQNLHLHAHHLRIHAQRTPTHLPPTHPYPHIPTNTLETRAKRKISGSKVAVLLSAPIRLCAVSVCVGSVLYVLCGV